MNSRVAKNSKKACEPCRRAKVRCNGEEPCQRCSIPASCVYRLKIRTRKKRKLENGAAADADATEEQHGSPNAPAASPLLVTRSIAGSAAGKAPASEPASTIDDEASQKVYHGITAMGSHPECTGQGDCVTENAHSQLFYGPSSNFAFLQQVHRGVLLALPQGDRGPQDHGGLNMFMQRSIFFGTPSRIPPDTPEHKVSGPLEAILPLKQALVFLDHFLGTSHLLFPLHTVSELRDMVHSLYPKDGPTRMSPQLKAFALAVIADGALCTTHTDLAEVILLRAKIAAAPFDEVVTLPMIQYSLLVSDYQLHMGRPNSAYLHIGIACRKALAMGLHKESTVAAGRQDNVQELRTTIWCLYFHDNWQSLAIGRSSALRMADITTPFPDDQALIVGICKAARIAEDSAQIIYGHRHGSLRQLYAAAQQIQTKLHEFAEEVGIGGVKSDTSKWAPDEGVALVQLQSFYYHSLILTFRPFLIIEYALRSQKATWQGEQMWLRQACRYAIDAAQDLILYASNKFASDERCRTVRFFAFFLESSCAVLLFDMLSHPSKHAYNLEFIQMAIHSLESMVHIYHEPVATACSSIKSILRAVEAAIGARSRAGLPIATGDEPSPATPPVPKIRAPTRPSFLGGPAGGEVVDQQAPRVAAPGPTPAVAPLPSPYLPNIQIPSMHSHTPQHLQQAVPGSSAMAEQMILFSDLLGGGAGNSFTSNGADGAMGPGPALDAHSSAHGLGTDNWPGLQFDVMTTDLYSFFPVDMTTPPDQHPAFAGDGPAGRESTAAGPQGWSGL